MALPFLHAALADLPAWRAAWRERAENPLAGAVALAARRQAGSRRQRNGRLLLRVLAGLVVAGIAMLLCDLAGMLPGGLDSALLISACAGAAGFFLLWLVAELWAGLSQATTALALQEKRASWVQLDDLLAITVLTPQEILIGLLWRPWLGLLRSALALGLFAASCLLPALEGAIGFGLSGRPLEAAMLAPLSLAVLAIGAMLSAAGIALYAALINRSLTASRLLPFAAASTLFSSLAWLPLAVFFYAEGANQFSAFEAPPWADAGNLLGGLLIAILTISLLSWGARFKALRVFGALLGAPGFAAVHLVFWMLLGAASMAGLLGYDSSEALGMLMLAMFRSWGLFALLNPAALPSGLCLGLPTSGSSWLYGWDQEPSDLVTIWWPLGYLAGGLVALLLLARFAVLAVEARRRGEG